MMVANTELAEIKTFKLSHPHPLNFAFTVQAQQTGD